MYSEHPLTMVKNAQKNREPTFVEYRIEVKEGSNLIKRIESVKNVIVAGFLFARTDFLENIKDYNKGRYLYYLFAIFFDDKLFIFLFNLII